MSASRKHGRETSGTALVLLVMMVMVVRVTVKMIVMDDDYSYLFITSHPPC